MAFKIEEITNPRGEICYHVTGATVKRWLKERESRVNGTEISALYGHGYFSEWELYQRKYGRIQDDTDIGDRGRAGKHLEPAIAKWIASEYEWKVRKVKGYWYNSAGQGATCDYEIISGFASEPVTDEHGVVSVRDVDLSGYLLEIKNVDALVFKGIGTDKGWESSGPEGNKTIEAPVHIELQCHQQIGVTGRPGCVVVAAVGGNRLERVIYHYDSAVCDALRERVIDFWHSIDAGFEPEPDFVKDSNAINKLFASRTIPIYDATHDSHVLELIEEYCQYRDEEKAAAEKKSSRKAELQTIIGSAHRVIAPGFSVSCTPVAPKPGRLITEEMVGQVIGGSAGYRAFSVRRSSK